MNKTKILVLAAHFDDELLGCGGYLHALSSRPDIETHVAIVASLRKTNGAYDFDLTHQLTLESIKVKERLGIDHYYFGKLLDEELYLKFADVRHFVEKLRDDIQPDLIYVQNPTDINQDHKTLFEAAKIAFRIGSYDKSFQLYTYEVPSSTDQGYESFAPTSWVAIPRASIQAKAEAMNLYSSEVTYQRSPEGIEIYAQFRGLQCRAPFAEAFRLIQSREELDI